MRRRKWWLVLVEVVEPDRIRRGLSIRAASRAAGMSESLWRQLVRGAHPNPGVGHRWPTRAQVIDMATAVGCHAPVAAALSATPAELEASRARLAEVPDAAEVELRHLRHLSDDEKAALITCLRDLRGIPSPPGRTPP